MNPKLVVVCPEAFEHSRRALQRPVGQVVGRRVVANLLLLAVDRLPLRRVIVALQRHRPPHLVRLVRLVRLLAGANGRRRAGAA